MYQFRIMLSYIVLYVSGLQLKIFWKGNYTQQNRPRKLITCRAQGQGSLMELLLFPRSVINGRQSHFIVIESHPTFLLPSPPLPPPNHSFLPSSTPTWLFSLPIQICFYRPSKKVTQGLVVGQLVCFVCVCLSLFFGWLYIYIQPKSYYIKNQKC